MIGSDRKRSIFMSIMKIANVKKRMAVSYTTRCTVEEEDEAENEASMRRRRTVGGIAGIGVQK